MQNYGKRNSLRSEEQPKAVNKFVGEELFGDSFIRNTHQLIDKVRQHPTVNDKNAQQDKPKKEFKESQASRLIWLAETACEVFHSSEMEAFASVNVNGHKQTKRINSLDFREWLGMLFYYAHKAAPSNQALQEAVNGLSGKAKYEGPEIEVHLRVAEHRDAIYLDLCNESWQVIAITKEGWEVLDDPPVRFRRSKGMLALPLPEAGGNIQELREFVNVTDDSFVLLLGWLIACFRPNKPFPVLTLQGEQGSAKTTTARVLRQLIVRIKPCYEVSLAVNTT